MLRRHKILELVADRNDTVGSRDLVEAEAEILPHAVQQAVVDFMGVKAFKTPLWAITALIDDGEPNWIYPWCGSNAVAKASLRSSLTRSVGFLLSGRKRRHSSAQGRLADNFWRGTMEASCRNL
eukprot:SAG31_NODE_6380_length_2039_cov_2.167526_2_plen_124_part_00